MVLLFRMCLNILRELKLNNVDTDLPSMKLAIAVVITSHKQFLINIEEAINKTY